MSDTIAAIATGAQVAAIGIVRLSGDRAIKIADALFTPQSGKAMSESAPHTLIYGRAHDRNGALLDLCLCTISRAPHSYTGEELYGRGYSRVSMPRLPRRAACAAR